MERNEAKISLKNVCYTYGAKTPYEIKALDNVSLDIKKE